MLEVAEAFDLSLSGIKSYFQRYKVFGEARLKNHNTNTWCYLEKVETKRMPNYKERCLRAIEFLHNNTMIGHCKEHYKLLEILGADNDEYYI